MRILTQEDALDFLLLYQQVFPQKNIKLENVQTIFTAEPCEIWVCDDETKKPKAFLYFWIIPEGFDIMDLGVHPDCRRQGLAKSLLTLLLEKAKSEKKRVLLEVSEKNTPAYELYSRLGFQETQRRRQYYQDGSTAILMQYEYKKG